MEVKVTSLSSKAELYIGVGTNISIATNFASYSSGHLVRVYKPEEIFINVYATGFIGGSFRVTYQHFQTGNRSANQSTYI